MSRHCACSQGGCTGSKQAITARPPESHVRVKIALLQASGEPTVVSKAETARRQALSEGDLKGAAAAEVSLLTAVLEAQFGQAHVEAEQGLIMMQVS